MKFTLRNWLEFYNNIMWLRVWFTDFDIHTLEDIDVLKYNGCPQNCPFLDNYVSRVSVQGDCMIVDL